MKLFAVAALFVLCASARAASTDAVVVDIPGDDSCMSATGEKGFDVATWSVGGTIQLPVGGTGSSAKPVLQDLVLTRNQDACSEALIKYFVSGTVLPMLTLTDYRTAGSQKYAAVTVTLTKTALVNYSISGGTGIKPTENLDFQYGQVCVQTIAQNADGTLKPPVKVCYNALTNVVS